MRRVSMRRILSLALPLGLLVLLILLLQAAQVNDLTILAQQPSLTITKTDAPDPVRSGGRLTYTLRITNGLGQPTTVTVTDTLDPNTTLVLSQTTSADSACSLGDGGSVVECILGDMAKGSQQTVTLVVTTSASFTGTLTNQAAVDSDGTTPHSVTADTDVKAVADLGITKAASPDPATAGDPLTYVLTVTNSGPMDAAGVVVTDTLPGGVAYGSSPTHGASCSHSAGIVTCDVGALASGASERIELLVDVNAGVTASLANAAEVAGDVIDENSVNNQTNITTPVIQSADVEIAKRGAPDPVAAGSVLTYTLDVSNQGPSTAQAVTVTDTLPAEVVYRSSDPSVGTFDQASGRWSVGDLAPAASATLTLVVDVDPSFTGVITNFAEVSSNTFDPITGTGNTDSVTTSVIFEADLQVAKYDDPDSVVAGMALTYTLIVTNGGPSNATGVVLTDTLPQGLATTDKYTASQGTFTPTTGIWSVGDMAPASVATLTFETLVDPGTRDRLTNTVQVSSQVSDPDPGSNVATVETIVKAEVDLEVVKRDFPDPVAAGTTLTYTVFITNHGPSEATGIRLTDTLPPSVTFASAIPAQTSGPNPLVWELGALGRGLSTTVTVVVTPDPWISTTLTNTVGVTADEPEPDPDPSPNQDTEETVVKPLCEVIQVTDTLADVVNAWPSIGGLGAETRVAYLSNGTGWEELFVATLTEPVQTQQATSSAVGTTHEPPAISGDGRRVAFVSDGDYDPWMANTDGSAEVFVYGTRFGGFENITGNAGSVFPGFVLPASPDGGGRRLTFAADYDYTSGNPDANLEIWLHDSTEGPFRQVDGGYAHACGLRADGSVACWGYDIYGQATAPSGPFLQVSAGGLHTCALRETGSLLCWGHNGYGQAPGVPIGQYRQVSAGRWHTCGLLESGAVRCWGDNYYGQAPAAPTGQYRQVSAGAYHTCGLQQDGAVQCWGADWYGQVSAVPTGQYRQVSAGAYHTCGLLESGAVRCWGDNYYGQAPAAPTGQYRQVSAGAYHTCGLLEGGAVQCWGDNYYGQTSVPDGSAPFRWVGAGDYGTCGVDGEGGAVCWGANWYGQASPPSGGRHMFQITDSTQSSSSHVATSGNGQYVAFLSNADLVPGDNGDGSIELFVARLDPDDLQIAQVTGTAPGVSISHPSISYDGSRIAFLAGGDLFMAELDPDNLSNPITLVQITTTDSGVTHSEPALSGDGRTIAFISNGALDPLRNNDDGNPELYLAAVDSPGTFTQVTLSESTVTNAAPSINHLGTQVAFVSDGNLRPPTGNPQGNQEVFVASCRFPLPAAKLKIQKTGPQSTVNGGTYPYTLTVTNEGQASAFGVTVVDQLVGSATLYPGDPRCEEQGQDKVTCYASELAAGATMTLAVWARVESTSGTLTNAVEAWAVNAPDHVTATLDIFVGDAADLSVEKSTPARWVEPGETITYTIVIANRLGSDTSVTVTDTVTTSVPYTAGAVTLPGGYCQPWQGGTLICTTPSLAAGETALLTLAITPLQSGVITNTVWVTSTNSYPDPDPANNESSVVLWLPPVYLPLILRGG